MKEFEQIKKRMFNTKEVTGYSVGIAGQIIHPKTKKNLTVIASIDQGKTEHVSVSTRNREPTWDEMCYIKDLCFYDEEVVIQFHPKKSEYVNMHENCLHMWRPVKGKENQFMIVWC